MFGEVCLGLHPRGLPDRFADVPFGEAGELVAVLLDQLVREPHPGGSVIVLEARGAQRLGKLGVLPWRTVDAAQLVLGGHGHHVVVAPVLPGGRAAGDGRAESRRRPVENVRGRLRNLLVFRAGLWQTSLRLLGFSQFSSIGRRAPLNRIAHMDDAVLFYLAVRAGDPFQRPGYVVGGGFSRLREVAGGVAAGHERRDAEAVLRHDPVAAALHLITKRGRHDIRGDRELVLHAVRHLVEEIGHIGVGKHLVDLGVVREKHLPLRLA